MEVFIKKRCFPAAVLSVLITVLFATMTLAACNNFTTPDKKPLLSESDPDEERIRYTEDGRTMVKLGIGPGSAPKNSSRALTDQVAMAAAERFEVAFYNAEDDEVYRASWELGERGSIWVYTSVIGVNYAAGGNGAILFAGYRDGTLLAIGRLIAVDGELGTTITDFSRTATFQLTSITNDVYGWGISGPNNPLNATFKLTGYDGGNVGFDAYLNDGPSAGYTYFRTVLIDGVVYPLFELPLDATFQASYRVDFGGSNAGIVTAGTPRVQSGFLGAVPGYITQAGANVSGHFTNVVHDPVAMPEGNPLPSGPFELELTTTAVSGLISIRIEIPIYAWSNVPGSNPTGSDVQPGRWRIQGGISNTSIDLGKNHHSAGGSILLGIGNYIRVYKGALMVYSNGVYGLPGVSITANTVNDNYGQNSHNTNPGGNIIEDFDVTVPPNGTNTKAIQIRMSPNIHRTVSFSIRSDTPVDLSGTGGLVFRIWHDGGEGNPLRWVSFGDEGNTMLWQGNDNGSNFNPSHRVGFDGNALPGGAWPCPQGWYTVFVPVPNIKTSGMVVYTLFSIGLEVWGDIAHPSGMTRQFLIDDIQFISAADVKLERIRLPAIYQDSSSNTTLEAGSTLSALDLFRHPPPGPAPAPQFMLFSANLAAYKNFYSTVYTWVCNRNNTAYGIDSTRHYFDNWELPEGSIIQSSNTNAITVTDMDIDARNGGTASVSLRIGNVTSPTPTWVTVIAPITVIEDFDYENDFSTFPGNERLLGFWGENLVPTGGTDGLGAYSSMGVVPWTAQALIGYNRGLWLSPSPNPTPLRAGRKFGAPNLFGRDGRDGGENLSSYSYISLLMYRFPAADPQHGTSITYHFALYNNGEFGLSGNANGAGTQVMANFTGEVDFPAQNTWVLALIPLSDFVGLNLNAVTGWAIVMDRTTPWWGSTVDNRIFIDSIRLHR